MANITNDMIKVREGLMLEDLLDSQTVIPVKFFSDDIATGISLAKAHLTSKGVGTVVVPKTSEYSAFSIKASTNKLGQVVLNYFTNNYRPPHPNETRPYGGGAWITGDKVINNDLGNSLKSTGWICVDGASKTWRSVSDLKPWYTHIESADELPQPSVLQEGRQLILNSNEPDIPSTLYYCAKNSTGDYVWLNQLAVQPTFQSFSVSDNTITANNTIKGLVHELRLSSSTGTMYVSSIKTIDVNDSNKFSEIKFNDLALEKGSGINVELSLSEGKWVVGDTGKVGHLPVDGFLLSYSEGTIIEVTTTGASVGTLTVKLPVGHGNTLSDQFTTLAGYVNTMKPNHVFSTIEELTKTTKYLTDGTVVEILGYYKSGDGAGHKRVISATDDGSGVPLGAKFANLAEGVITPEFFGARGDGLGDDTEPMSKATTFANAKNLKIVAIKTYLLKSTIELFDKTEMADAVFYFETSFIGEAVVVGKTKFFEYANISLPQVRKKSVTAANLDVDCVGVSLWGASSSNFKFNLIEGFKSGLLIEARNNLYFAYNKLNLNRIYDCKDGLVIRAVWTESVRNQFTNQNVFIGGDIKCSSRINSTRTDFRKIVLDKQGLHGSCNENVFYETSIEGASDVSVYMNVSGNNFNNLRYEELHEGSIVIDINSVGYLSRPIQFNGGYSFNVKLIKELQTKDTFIIHNPIDSFRTTFGSDEVVSATNDKMNYECLMNKFGSTKVVSKHLYNTGNVGTAFGAGNIGFYYPGQNTSWMNLNYDGLHCKSKKIIDNNGLFYGTLNKQPDHSGSIQIEGRLSYNSATKKLYLWTGSEFKELSFV